MIEQFHGSQSKILNPLTDPARSGEGICLMRTTFLPFCLGLALVSAKAAAQVQFLWKADSSVEVGIGQTVVKGHVREGTTQELTAGNVTVTVIPFSNAFIAVAWVDSGRDQGSFVILERQNSQYIQLTREIRGQAGSLVNDLKSVVQALEKSNRWDHSLALRALAAHFAAQPNDTLREFLEAVELGKLKPLSKPDPKATPRRPRPERPVNPGFAGEGPDTPMPISPRAIEVPRPPAEIPVERPRPQRPPPVRREPRPWEPQHPGYDPQTGRINPIY